MDREETGPVTVMNPCVGAGDVVQLRLDGKDKPVITKVELPNDWKLVGESRGFVASDGTTWFTVQVPEDAEQGKQTLRLHPAEGKVMEAAVEVVRRIGK